MASENFAFGYWIKRHRKARDLTQAQLAEQVGIATVTLRKIEADERRPSLQLAQRLANLLELTEDERTTLLRVVRMENGPQHLDLPDHPLPAPVYSNLPVPLQNLIGRDAELAALTGLLQRAEVRLVTVTGPGGSGKTHLALQVAHDLRSRYGEHVWFVDLGVETDPDRLACAIAQALGLIRPGERMLSEHIQDFLRDKRGVLVLDNFEHLLAAAPQLTDLLVTAPQLKILATSRAVLRLRIEYEYVLTPLAVPPSGHDQTALQIAQYSAVQLFIARAQVVQPAFVLTDENAPTVAAICRQLDGLPLAIELAAMRLRMFTPHHLLEQLESPLATLTIGARDLPPRQQTLRATIAWSYHLLNTHEQRLLRRLAVCRGSFTLDAVDALYVQPEGFIRTDDAGFPSLVLQSLVEQSLVVRTGQPDAAPRFRLLETVRTYALEQLVAQGELEEASCCHARYYVSQALPDNAAAITVDEWLKSIADDHANIRAAEQWLRQFVRDRVTPSYRQHLTMATNTRAVLQSPIESALLGAFSVQHHRSVVLHDTGVTHARIYASTRAVCESPTAMVDLIHLDQIWLHEFAPYLADLREICADELAVFDPQFLDHVSVDGRVLALPIFSEVGGLYYRPDLLRRYGFSAPPATWDELELQARTIMVGERQKEPSFDGLLFHTDLTEHEGLTCVALEWLAAHGATVEFTNDGIRLNQPQAVAALNRARGWIGTIAPPITHPVNEFRMAIERFRAGKAAFLRAFSYTYMKGDGAIEDVLNGKVAFAPLPAQPAHKPVGVVGAWLLGILQRSARRDDAIACLRSYAGLAAARYRALLGQALPMIPHLAERIYACENLPLTTSYKQIDLLWRPAHILGQHYPAFSRTFAHVVHRILAGEDAAVLLPKVEQTGWPGAQRS